MSSPGGLPSVADITGPMLLGHLFNYALLGVLSIQVYIYSLSFRGDKRAIQALVYTLFLLDIIQTAFATHYAWYVLASGWGNPLVIRFTPWSLTTVPPFSGTIALLVQLFFAWRIWILGQGNRLYYVPVLVLIIVSASGSCAAAFYSGIVSGKLRDVTKASQLDPEVTGWLAGSVACDTMITVTLVYQLASKRGQGFRSANNILHRAIRMTIETGALTTVVVTLELILFLNSKTTGWYFMLGMLIGKLYSNSLLASLNSRAPIFQGSSVQTQSDSIWYRQTVSTRGNEGVRSGGIAFASLGGRSTEVNTFDLEVGHSNKQNKPHHKGDRIELLDTDLSSFSSRK